MDRRRSWLCWWFCLASLLVMPLTARADGKVFSQVTAVRTTTPDQRALLHFALPPRTP